MDDQKKLSFDRAENRVFIGFLQENAAPYQKWVFILLFL